MDGHPHSRRGGRGGGSHSHRGGRGGSSHAHHQLHHGGHSHQSSVTPSSEMFFPLAYVDTSSFQLPSGGGGGGSHAPQPTGGKTSRGPRHPPEYAHDASSSSASSFAAAHPKVRSSQARPDDEFIALDDDSDVDEFAYEDDLTIFEMAEEAMLAGQLGEQAPRAPGGKKKFKQAKQQQQQQQAAHPAQASHSKPVRTQGGCFICGSPAHRKADCSEKGSRHPHPHPQQPPHSQQQHPAPHHGGQLHTQSKPLHVVTKQEREERARQLQAQLSAFSQVPPPDSMPQQHNHGAHHHAPAHSSHPHQTHAHHGERIVKHAGHHKAAPGKHPHQHQQPHHAGQPQMPPASQPRNNHQAQRNNQQQSQGGGAGRYGRPLFPEHLAHGVMLAGLKAGVYLQGTLRIVGSNAFVTVAGLQRDLFIEGRKSRNRAYDGDIVCVQVVGFDAGAGSKQHAFAQQAASQQSHKAAHHAGGRQGKNAALEASLLSLIAASEQAEDQRMAQEKTAAAQKANGKKANQATADAKQPLVEEETDEVLTDATAMAAASSALVTQLSAADPSVQHKAIVLGVMQARFPVVHAPGVLKPFNAQLALFVPLDKKTPFAMVTQRAWPEPFASEYRKYLANEATRKAEKDAAKRKAKIAGNFPHAPQDSSDIVLEKSPETASSASTANDAAGEEAEVDAMTAATAPDSIVLDPHIYVGVYQPWATHDRQPFCTIQSNLGLSGNIRAETEALLVANGVDYDHDGAFSQAVLSEVASYSAGGKVWQIPEEEIAKRRDLRDQTKWRIVSIDPTTARDLDDAIHIKQMEDDPDLVEIGVHIADVAHFVRPGTALDAEARHRATTIYLVQKAIPMLPPILCEQLCSLNPNVDRLSYSCIFYMHKSTGRVSETRKPWFGRTVIRTCARLNYETAQLLMEFDRSKLPQGRDVTEADFEGDLKTAMSPGHAYRPVDCVSIQQLLDDMQLLHAVSMRRRADRFATGSLTLSNVKLQFQTDADRNPIGFYTYVIRDSNRVVEECMLLANQLVAAQCVQFCKNIALLRRHPPPNEKSMSKVNQTCRELGFDIDATTAGSLQRSLDAYEGMFVGRKHGVNDETTTEGTIPIRQVLEPLCTKPMQLAVYFCTGTLADAPKEWAHYALHFSEYTHFTSPIRRYADVIVHRVLTYSLELEAWMAAQQKGTRPRPPKGLTPGDVVEIADTCNTRKANAKKAQEASSKVYLCDYLLRKHADVPLSAGAIITDMFAVEGNSDQSFEILIPHLGLQKAIHLNDLIKQGKIISGTIEPRDLPEQTKQQDGVNQKTPNRAARRQQLQSSPSAPAGVSTSAPPAADSTASSSTSVGPSTAQPSAAPKGEKRLTITWPDGTRNAYRIFEAIDVELIVRRGPPMDLDAFCISPATAAEREKQAAAAEIDPSGSVTPVVVPPTDSLDDRVE